MLNCLELVFHRLNLLDGFPPVMLAPFVVPAQYHERGGSHGNNCNKETLRRADDGSSCYNEGTLSTARRRKLCKSSFIRRIRISLKSACCIAQIFTLSDQILAASAVEGDRKQKSFILLTRHDRHRYTLSTHAQ